MNKKPEVLDISNIIKETLKDEKEEDNNNGNKGMDIDSLKALEIAKIVVQESLDIKNINSLSFLNTEQIDDIVKAKLLNSYYNIPEIDDYISNFLQLKRSQEGQLMRLFVKMVMFNNENEDTDKKGFFRSIIKR